jgi:hypothetical protein
MFFEDSNKNKIEEVEEFPSNSEPFYEIYPNENPFFSPIDTNQKNEKDSNSLFELQYQLQQKDFFIQQLQQEIQFLRMECQQRDTIIQQLQLNNQMSTISLSEPKPKEKIKLVQVFRFYSKTPIWKYCYSLNPEGQPKNFLPEKGKFEYFKSPDPGTPGVFAVWRLKSKKNYSQGFCFRQKPNPNSKDWEPDEICCYLFQDRMPKTIPIFLKGHKDPYRECLSTSEPEQSGWKNLKIIGYAYDNLVIL